jgi:hypothetical protein
MGSIYISNSRGDSFAHSLSNAVRMSDGVCDFDKVHSLNGVFIANVYDSKKVEQMKNNNNNNNRRKSRESSPQDLDSYK